MQSKGQGAQDTYTITYLEMTTPPGAPVPPPPLMPSLSLIGAKNPPVAYFYHLYRSVGDAYDWTDRLRAPRAETEAFVRDPNVFLTSLLVDGWPGGFYMLDAREKGVCDLAYFGLVPCVHGRGLGRWLLANAIAAGWALPGTRRLTVNTCSLDHPRALALYQKAGFRVYARRDVSRPPAIDAG